MNSSLIIEEIEKLKDTPWVKDMLNTLGEKLTTTVLSFAHTAKKLSSNKRDIESWVQVFQEQYEENCEDLLNDIKHLEAETLNKVEKSLTRIQELCKMLQVEMPDLGHEKLSLYQEQHILKKHIAEYEQIVEKRKKQMNELLTQQEALCKSLARSPKKISKEPLLSQAELKQLQEQIEDLENEHFHRLEKYTEIKNEILQIATVLKYKPSSEFEKMICDEHDVREFCVSDENMKHLGRLKDKLSSEMQKVTKEIDELWTSINHHWNLLDTDMVEREVFRKENQSVSYLVRDRLREEVKRCEELKKANIKIFVERLRDELKEVWHKCRCTDSVKADFGFFNTACYTEDLLELHENEIKKWKNYYEENKELILLLEKHQKLWKKMIELEENATGANRYNNRGGQLLKEEKERNKLSKNIPIIESELQVLADKYESLNGTRFLTFGQTVEEYVGNLHAERENWRKQKLSARKQQRDNTITIGNVKSTLQQNGTTPAVSSTKRKLLTPLMENQKVPRLTPRLVATEPKKTGKNPKIIVTRYSTERKKRMEKIKRRSLLRRQQKGENETVSSEYGAFENELSARVGCRSTINPLIEELPATSRLACTTTKTPSKMTLCAAPSRPYTPKSERRTPRTPLTPNGANRQLATAKSSLKLIF